VNTRKDPSATAQMIAVMDSVEKVKETVTGTVTVLASWSVARQTVWGKGLMIMMIAVRNLRNLFIFMKNMIQYMKYISYALFKEIKTVLLQSRWAFHLQLRNSSKSGFVLQDFMYPPHAVNNDVGNMSSKHFYWQLAYKDLKIGNMLQKPN
jgi:hypothetical protein